MPRLSAWLLLLLGLGPLWATASRETEEQDGAKDQCFQTRPVEAGALNLGQKWGDPSPTAMLTIDLRMVTSAASSFEFRTFDPEGIVFYGDMSTSADWFVLGLRRGKPEMQIHNRVTNISVSGGQRLNDGQWHRIVVKNEGHSVMLEVDEDDALTLRHVSHAIIQDPSFHVRIAVGGLLIPRGELLTPMNPAMDGCMRHWNWLNQSTEWPEEASLQGKGSKACFATIRRGAFFPGDGRATFPLSGLPAGLGTDGESWSLAVEMQVRAPQQVGTLLAVSAAQQTPVLSLKLQGTDLVAQLGNQTAVLVPLPVGGCLDAPLAMHITPAHLTLRLGDRESAGQTEKPDFERLQHLWLGKDGRLDVGALPGQEETPQAQEGTFFRGCLREIRVQGHQLDFDAAQSRSNSIWAHSCPGDESHGTKPSTDGGN
ncbi:sex hormone-binding globulin [Hemicordylus capensis]|uniref:sex hormone-binding globulin n=1 Tax=Hemicordylus capensis TaxID=884348 RepID=UPI002302C0B1|nr:sex hormone-binding globulin [Hemicordylus capensis]